MESATSGEASAANHDRRGVILSVLAGATAWWLGARGREAEAATGDPMRLGRRNRADAVTSVLNSTEDQTALRARARGSGSVAVRGVSRRGTGVHGSTESGNGVSGESVFGIGVSGHSIEPGSYAVSGNGGNGIGVQGGSHGGVGVQGNCAFGIAVQGGNVSETEPAVQGWAQNGQTGVMGLSTTLEEPDEVTSPRDVGVFGVCDQPTGRGVLARSESGLALQARGRIKLSTSGTAVVPAGGSEVTVTPTFAISSSSKVLATLQADPGGAAIAWVDVDAAAGSFTIHLTAAVESRTAVAWLVLD